MFSGIVQATSKVVSVSQGGRVRRVRIQKPRAWRLSDGQSIAVDGICSTVVSYGRTYFDVEYMPETMTKTTASLFARGAALNLERSLVYGDRIDGHLVQGHVDAKARVVSLLKKGRSRELSFILPRPLVGKIALHGSIAVNGVSLTVARLAKSVCTVALIPHTLEKTNLGELKKGNFVNIELDRTPLLARKDTRGRVGRNAAKGVRQKKKNG